MMKRLLLPVLLVSTMFGCAGATATTKPAAAKAEAAAWHAVPVSDVRILIERSTDQMKHQQAVLYGNGLAFWNDSVQFQVTPEQFNQVLGAFDKYHFDQMRSSKEGERLRRRAGIRAGSYNREVLETWEETLAEEERKEESESGLDELTERAFDVVAPVAEKGGVTASDMNDALAKIKSGVLAEEALTVAFMVRPEVGRTSQQQNGFVLRIEDKYASTSKYENGSFGVPVRVRLTDGTVRELASQLLDADIATLPANLYATDYEDFTASTMRFRKNVVARQWASLTPAKFPDAQKRYAAVAKWFTDLNESLVRK